MRIISPPARRLSTPWPSGTQAVPRRRRPGPQTRTWRSAAPQALGALLPQAQDRRPWGRRSRRILGAPALPPRRPQARWPPCGKGTLPGRPPPAPSSLPPAAPPAGRVPLPRGWQDKKSSSQESVGRFRHRQVSHYMVEGKLKGGKGAVAVCPLAHHLGPTPEPFPLARRRSAGMLGGPHPAGIARSPRSPPPASGNRSSRVQHGVTPWTTSELVCWIVSRISICPLRI